MRQAEHILSPRNDVVGENSADLIDVTLQGFRAEVMENPCAVWFSSISGRPGPVPASN